MDVRAEFAGGPVGWTLRQRLSYAGEEKILRSRAGIEDGLTRRRGEARERIPCLLVPLSPRLLVTPSPCLRSPRGEVPASRGAGDIGHFAHAWRVRYVFGNMKDRIVIRGARQHNLKNLDLDLPRRAVVVVT